MDVRERYRELMLGATDEELIHMIATVDPVTLRGALYLSDPEVLQRVLRLLPPERIESLMRVNGFEPPDKDTAMMDRAIVIGTLMIRSTKH